VTCVWNVSRPARRLSYQSRVRPPLALLQGDCCGDAPGDPAVFMLRSLTWSERRELAEPGCFIILLYVRYRAGKDSRRDSGFWPARFGGAPQGPVPDETTDVMARNQRASLYVTRGSLSSLLSSYRDCHAGSRSFVSPWSMVAPGTGERATRCREARAGAYAGGDHAVDLIPALSVCRRLMMGASRAAIQSKPPRTSRPK